jgi:hypothetical protein
MQEAFEVFIAGQLVAVVDLDSAQASAFRANLVDVSGETRISIWRSGVARMFRR